jgi:hypothetical protein
VYEVFMKRLSLKNNYDALRFFLGKMCLTCSCWFSNHLITCVRTVLGVDATKNYVLVYNSTTFTYRGASTNLYVQVLPPVLQLGVNTII